MLLVGKPRNSQQNDIYRGAIGERPSNLMPLSVSTKGTTASQFPLYKIIEILFLSMRYLQDYIEPAGSAAQEIDAQGPCHFWLLNLAWYSSSFESKQLEIPAKQAQGAPLQAGALQVGSKSILSFSKMLSWVRISCSYPIATRLQKQYPQTLQGSISSVSLAYCILKQSHSSDCGRYLQAFQYMEAREGLTKDFPIINSQVLYCKFLKVITPFPTKMLIRFILAAEEAWILYLSMRTARSGIYFPAYDYPEIQNLLVLYYGNLAQKSLRDANISQAVLLSLCLQDLSKLYENPTPAGDQMKSRFEALCHEQGFSMS